MNFLDSQVALEILICHEHIFIYLFFFAQLLVHACVHACVCRLSVPMSVCMMNMKTVGLPAGLAADHLQLDSYTSVSVCVCVSVVGHVAIHLSAP